MFKIPAQPEELLDKTKTVVKYFVTGKGFTTKCRMHTAVLETLSPFRKEKLINFRTTLMYILPYLSKSFEVSTKQRVLIDHYSYLQNNFSKTQLHELFSEDGVEIYNEKNETDRYSIWLKSVTSHLEFEGSLSLLFKQNDDALYSLSFSIIRGEVFGVDAPYVIYVTAMQGTKNAYEKIKVATKYFKENSSPVMLLKALEAVALSLGITLCVGISANCHLSLKDMEQFERFFNNYDVFWTNNGATLMGDNYLLKFPLEQKPIEQIAQAHRNRTLKKRQKMQEVSAGITKMMNAFLGKETVFTAEYEPRMAVSA